MLLSKSLALKKKNEKASRMSKYTTNLTTYVLFVWGVFLCLFV